MNQWPDIIYLLLYFLNRTRTYYTENPPNQGTIANTILPCDFETKYRFEHYGRKKILTYIRVFTISQKIIHRGWGGKDFPDIPTNTEGAARPRPSSSFLLILPIVLSSGATEFNVNEEITNCLPIPPLSRQFALSEN